MKKLILSLLLFCSSYGVFAVDTITILNIFDNTFLPQNNFCQGSSIIVNFSSTLPAGTFYTTRLKLNGKVVATYSGLVGYSSLNIPDFPIIESSSNYKIDIISSNILSAESNYISIGTQYTASISDGLIVNSNFFQYDYICQESSKKYFAVVQDCAGNVIKNGITYQWKNSGNALAGETGDQITVNTNYGGLSYDATMNGVTIKSKQVVAQISNSINSTIKEEFIYEGCEGTVKKLISSYHSNTASYLWSKNGINIPNANERYYLSNEAANYTLSISEPNCTINTPPLGVSFYEGLQNTIYSATGDTTICQGKPITIFAKNKNRVYPTLKFQWQRNGVNIEISENLNANNYYISTSIPGTYNVIYQQDNCITRSNDISIVSDTKAQKPTITFNEAFEICKGVVRINQKNSNLVGQWFKNGVELSGFFSSEYVANQSGFFKMIYGSDGCEIESNEINLNFGNIVLPKIETQMYAICGTNTYTSLRVNVDNLPNLNNYFNFQWKKDGINLSGETSQYLTVYQPGFYSLELSNNTCSNISNILEIKSLNRSLKIIPETQNNDCNNQLKSLFLELGSSFFPNTPTFIWKLNGTVLNSEKKSYIFTTKAGIYTVDYSSNGCSGTSEPFTLSAYDVPKPPNVNPQIINYGNSATLLATGCNGTVSWFNVSSGGTSLATGFEFTTPIINSDTKFYAECANASCTSIIRKEVLVSICESSTTKSGSWNDPTVWSCGLIPNFGTNATISNGHNIVVPLGIHELKNIKLEGTVNFETGGEIKVNGGN